MHAFTKDTSINSTTFSAVRRMGGADGSEEEDDDDDDDDKNTGTRGAFAFVVVAVVQQLACCCTRRLLFPIQKDDMPGDKVAITTNTIKLLRSGMVMIWREGGRCCCCCRILYAIK
jgi:hypothetical protein